MTKPLTCPPRKLSWIEPLLRNHRPALLTLLALLDVTMVVIALQVTALLFLLIHPGNADWSEHFSFTIAVAFCAIPVFERFGLYRQQSSMMNLIEIRKILRSVLVLSAGMAAYAIFFQSRYPPNFLVLATAIMLYVVLSWRMLLFKVQQYLRLRGIDVRRVLIVGADATGCLLYQSICQAPKLGYKVVGILDADPNRQQQVKECLQHDAEQDLVLYNDPAQLQEIVVAQRVDALFVTNLFHDSGATDILALATICQAHGVQLHFIPYLRGFATLKAQLQDINGISIISFGAVAPGRMEQLGKRVFDLVLAGLLLILLLPVFATLALCIRRDSTGPIFFKQTRVGKNGYLFSMYKFRTMYTETPTYGFSPRSSQDPRITPLGRLLRKTSLDELPQLWNVIRGEMSLVGPRPEMPFIVEQIDNELYRQRLLVKPGITGVWQISGDRTREIHENISYDIFYIENRSILLDIIIIIRTMIFGVLAMRTH